MHNPRGANITERFATTEAEHLGNAQEATLFYHPQYVYNGSRTSQDGTVNPDRIVNDKIDGAPQADPALLGSDAVSGYYTYNASCDVSYQIQLGSRVYPIMEVKTSQEAYYELLKTIGAHELYSTFVPDILPREYRSWKFIMACSFENGEGPFQGVSTKNGDLLTIKLKNCQHNNLARFDGSMVLPFSVPEYIYCVLEADHILTISDVGVAVWD